jgi:hypothetical protein
MLDDTGCSLKISGILSSQGATVLSHVLVAQNLCGGNPGREKIFESLMEGNGDWDFDSVRNGKMGDRLRQTLDALGLDFTWSWNWGDSYGPGVFLRNNRLGTEERFYEAEEQICLTVAELGQTGRIEAAQRWAAFRENLKLFPFRSGHELTAILKANPEFISNAEALSALDYNTIYRT